METLVTGFIYIRSHSRQDKKHIVTVLHGGEIFTLTLNCIWLKSQSNRAEPPIKSWTCWICDWYIRPTQQTFQVIYGARFLIWCISKILF